MAPKKASRPAQTKVADSYEHKTADSPMRPDVGTQAQFKKRKPPKTYRYDTSLDPALSWDGGNGSRALGEWLLARIVEASRLPAPHRFPEPQRLTGGDGKTLATVRGLEDAAEQLRAIERPFLNWSGKAERLSFDVPTLPLFIHERLSTKAIVETLKGHKRTSDQMDLFGDPQHSIVEQSLRAYEYRDRWVNRMILGDSLAVMNSLVEYEGMRGQVQMIFMDPPYGVKFGSNFQPFVRKRDVTHNEDEDMTREPEMVQAYRDTWELGLHSYLTYLRDRLLLARELLTQSGSIFVQISDENVHLVRTLMDDVFGRDNFISTIVFQKTSSEEGEGVANTSDYLLWYCREKERFKSAPLYREKKPGEPGAKQYVFARLEGTTETRRLTPEEMTKPDLVPPGWVICRRGYPLTSQDASATRSGDFVFQGKPYSPGKNRHWSVSPDRGLPSLVSKGRIYSTERSLAGVMDLHDMPGSEIGNVWTDTGTGSFTDEQLYVVQTAEKVLERCILMATEPGDLILDPTCGSGTTVYCAEKWARRWITVDMSRVPLALARQRILTATYPYFKLVDETRGPASGLIFSTREESCNRKADGYGIAMQHTLSSIAGDEPATPIVFHDKPEIDYGITRVSGTFCVEATIPSPSDLEGMGDHPNAENVQAAHEEAPESFTDRMMEILRRSPLLRLPGNRNVELSNIRKPAKSLSLQAEALVSATAEGQDATLADATQEALEASGDLLGGLTKRPVAFIFGPENGAVSEKLVYEAAREAHAKNYTHLYVIGFAIHPNARQLVEQSEQMIGIRSTYVQMTPDVLMGDLLKNMRSSQIFSVCGLPEVELRKRADGQYEVELLGLDVFDPATNEASHQTGDDVPAWFLDTDYNGLCFHVSQAFFPRTSAWDALKKALKADYEATVWDHLAGTVSAPFEPNGHGEIAVKVIDDRGNELMVTKKLAEAKKAK